MRLRDVFVFLSLLLLAACDGGDRSTSSEIITIGAALPLTGGTSYYGQDSKKGIDLALDEINGKGGIGGSQLKVIFEDSLGNGQGAVSAVRKLIDFERVQVIIGCGTSTETMAAAPVVEQAQRVLLSPVSSAASLSTAGDYVFRTVPSDGQQALDLAAWVREAGISKVAVIFVNQTWGNGLKDGFVEAFKAGGGEVLDAEATELGETDFRAHVTKLASLSPDAVIAVLYAKEGGLFVKQSRELGASSPIFGADPWTKADFLATAGDAAEGIRFTTPAKYRGPEYDAFAKAYRTRYNADPGIYDAHGYDALNVIAAAMTSGARTGPEIRQALMGVSFRGATGETSFDVNGDVPTKGFARMTWEGGHAVPATKPPTSP